MRKHSFIICLLLALCVSACTPQSQGFQITPPSTKPVSNNNNGHGNQNGNNNSGNPSWLHKVEFTNL